MWWLNSGLALLMFAILSNLVHVSNIHLFRSSTAKCCSMRLRFSFFPDSRRDCDYQANYLKLSQSCLKICQMSWTHCLKKFVLKSQMEFKQWLATDWKHLYIQLLDINNDDNQSLNKILKIMYTLLVITNFYNWKPVIIRFFREKCQNFAENTVFQSFSSFCICLI